MPTMRSWFLGSLLAAACTAAAAAPKPIEVRVSAVDGGDTLWLQPAAAGAAALQVRLAGIDAPLSCQPWGPEARAALQEWVLGHDVLVKPAGRVVAGRVVGTVLLDGASINERMVAEGHAWSQHVRWDHGPYVKQGRMAHALGRGMYAAGGALRPQEFLRQHGPCVAQPAPAR